MGKKQQTVAVKERVQKFTRRLRVQLSDKEVAERADRAAHLLAERDAKEEERKNANTAMKNQIEEVEAQLRNLSNEVRDHATYRDVECERRYDYQARTVREKRDDTNEVLELRAMRTDELQLTNGLEVEPPATSRSPVVEGQKLGDAVAENAPPLATQKRGKPKAKKPGKGRARAEARP